jgi:hypothetical protein
LIHPNEIDKNKVFRCIHLIKIKENMLRDYEGGLKRVGRM